VPRMRDMICERTKRETVSTIINPYSAGLELMVCHRCTLFIAFRQIACLEIPSNEESRR